MSPTRISLVAPPDRFDAAIVACGYEARSSFFLDARGLDSERKVCIGYNSHECLDFQKNYNQLTNSGYSFISVEDGGFRECIRHVRDEALGADGSGRFFVDISCLTRYRLATVVEELCAVESEVTFFYSLAEFEAPGLEQPLNEFLEPVSTFFSGWSGDLEKPTAVVSGLGYEYMRAIGVIDHLDAANAWLFFPCSPINKYDRAVEKANELILRDWDESRLIKYDMSRFSDLCRDLFSLSSSLRLTHRCVLLPLGPKLFALATLLAGVAYRDLAVWRVSAGGYALPVNRKPSEHFYEVTVKFDKQ